MTYQEYGKKREKEINSLPIFYAFSNKQLEEALKERGFESLDEGVKHIYKLGDTGGFYLKKDAEKIRKYFNRKDDLCELMQDEEFAVSAFEYEMENHEYAINYYQGDWDVCSCFCKCEWEEYKTFEDYLLEGGYSDTVVSYYRKALKIYNEKTSNWY